MNVYFWSLIKPEFFQYFRFDFKPEKFIQLSILVLFWVTKIQSRIIFHEFFRLKFNSEKSGKIRA